MILKFRTLCKYPADGVEGEYGQEQWHYIDEIAEASTYYDKGMSSVCVRITDSNKMETVIALHDEAYLLNNEGKIIEKVRS